MIMKGKSAENEKFRHQNPQQSREHTFEIKIGICLCQPARWSILDSNKTYVGAEGLFVHHGALSNHPKSMEAK
jgi:hypothetical protein